MNLQPANIQHGPRYCRTPQEPHLRACRCLTGGLSMPTLAANTDTNTDKENNNDND